MKFVGFRCRKVDGESLPMRERGLKYNGGRGQLSKPLSLPMRGAWIEICSMAHGKKYLLVAPHAGNAIKLSKILIAHVGNSVCFFHAFFLKVNNKTKKLIK